MDRAGVKKMALIPPLCPDLVHTSRVGIEAWFLRRLMADGGGPFRKTMFNMYRAKVKKDGKVEVGGVLYQVFEQPDMAPLQNAVRTHPDRFMGWVFVNPAGPEDPVAMIERFASIPGMIGVKAHPYWHAYPVEKLESAAALCEEKGMPMLIHLGAKSHGDYKLLPGKFPKLKVIYAHAGVPCYREVCEYAGQKENAFVDLSGPGYMDLRIARRALDRAGAGKCLFGSDGPYFRHHDGRFDFSVVLDIIHGLGLGKDDLELVTGKNFERITAR